MAFRAPQKYVFASRSIKKLKLKKIFFAFCFNANLYPVYQRDDGLFEKVGKSEHPNVAVKVVANIIVLLTFQIISNFHSIRKRSNIIRRFGGVLNRLNAIIWGSGVDQIVI